MKLGAFLAALVVLTATAAGLTLYSTSDHVSTTSNRNGQLTFWFQANEPGTFAVNTEGSIVTNAEPSFGDVDAGAVKSFVVTFSPPLCSQGTFYSTVNLDFATASNGATQRVSKVIELNVQRSTDCSTVTHGFPATLASSESSNAYSGSSLSLSNRFDPSEVNLAIRAPEGKGNIASGETTQVVFDVVNRGSPGLVGVNVLSDPNMNALLDVYSFTLERAEAKRLTLSVRPQGLTGRNFVTIQVSRSGQVAAVRAVYFDVANNHLLELTMPQVIDADNCGVVTMAGSAANKGSADERVSVSIPSLLAASNEFDLPARSNRSFVLNVDLSPLSPNARLIDVVLSSNAAATKQVVKLNVQQCTEKQLFNFSTSFTNTGNATLFGVVASVTGVPSNWEVSTQVPVNIAPGEVRQFSALVKPTGEWSTDVVPTLVVKDASGNTLQSQQLSPIKPNASTGLFLAGLFGLSGLQWIAAIVFVALIIALATARYSWQRNVG